MIKIDAFECQALLNVLAGCRERIDHYQNVEKDTGYRADNDDTIEELTLAIKSLRSKLKQEAA